jgi:HEAT repeat protein/beta-lactamase regulating signal transducer with metallopeptidase domain
MTETLIKATVLLAVVAVAAYLMRRSSAALRHLLWTLAIVGLVALPVLTAVVPFRLPILPSANAVGGARPIVHPDLDVPPALGDPARAETRTPPPVHRVSESANTIAADTKPAGFSTEGLLFGTWLAVLLVLLARFITGFVIVRGIARRATPIADQTWTSLAARAARTLDVKGPIDLRRSDDVAMPFACGLIKPIIVLPASSSEWSSERRQAVLMHELAHISRGDLAMNMLSHIVRAVYWFHPLAWLAAYRLRVEGERACDDAVLRAGALPSDYAEHLLSIVRTVGSSVPSVALAMARRSDFEGRLLAILEPGVPRSRLTRLRAAVLAGMFLAAVMPLAAMAPASTTANYATANSATANSATANNTTINNASTSNKLGVIQAAPTSQVPTQTAAPSSPVSALIETLTDATVSVRLAAVNSLGALGDPRAIAALAKALKEDSDARVREAAAHSLGEIDDVRAVPALNEALKVEKVAAVKEKIVRALGEIDDASAVAGIMTVVKDPSTPVRRAAAWALGELEDASAVPALLSMVRDEDAEVRRYVAEALGNLENPAAIDALIAMTRDSDAEVRSHAISALDDFEDPRALAAYVAALKDSDPDVRQHAANAISNIDEIKAAPPALIEALADTDSDVRQSVAHALGNIGDEKAVPGLKRLVSDSDTDVRRAAVEALSEIGGVEALQALMGLLKDQDPEIRRVAAEALGKRRND